MDVRAHNREVWNRLVREGNRWTVPVSAADVAAARAGTWQLWLTPTTPTPRRWFPPLAGRDVLCLAGGGGQQGPILAAAGATVTVFDVSAQQLAQDRSVADRDGLCVRTEQGDMADLSRFADHSFDLVVHPVANVYVPEIRPVWAEVFRVLRPGGVLLAAFINPMTYIFDQDRAALGRLEVRFALPYSELDSISPEERQRLIAQGDALQFSHTLDDQIGGQLEVGFVLTGFYEDRRSGHPLAPYMATHMATRALKPARVVG